MIRSGKKHLMINSRLAYFRNKLKFCESVPVLNIREAKIYFYPKCIVVEELVMSIVLVQIL